MCWALNHQNIIEMAQGHISLSVVAAKVSTRDLVQEYLENRIFPTSSGW
jgi:selenophosphate synthase